MTVVGHVAVVAVVAGSLTVLICQNVSGLHAPGSVDANSAFGFLWHGDCWRDVFHSVDADSY